MDGGVPVFMRAEENLPTHSPLRRLKVILWRNVEGKGARFLPIQKKLQ